MMVQLFISHYLVKPEKLSGGLSRESFRPGWARTFRSNAWPCGTLNLTNQLRRPFQSFFLFGEAETDNAVVGVVMVENGDGALQHITKMELCFFL